MHTTLEVAVTGEHRAGGEVAGRYGGGDLGLQRSAITDAVVHADGAGDERMQIVHGEVVYLAFAGRASIHNPERESRQRPGFILDAVALWLSAARLRWQRCEPTAHAKFLEQLCRGGEVTALAVQWLKRARAGPGQS